MVQNLLDAHCHLKGNVVCTYDGIETEAECYNKKLDHEEGRYFLFNKEDQQCMIYDSNERNCLAYHGPEGVSSCKIHKIK